MTRISFGPLFHQTLGFENFIRDVEKILDSEIKPSTFPPHNIIKSLDNRYYIEIAVAGFTKNEIDIQVQEGNLFIKGEKKHKKEVTYLHQGIGNRSFTKVITLADTIEVKGADIKDGILCIELENIIPEHKKPRKVEIGNNLSDYNPQLLQEQEPMSRAQAENLRSTWADNLAS
jgi:molecular chaperone IbpA